MIEPLTYKDQTGYICWHAAGYGFFCFLDQRTYKDTPFKKITIMQLHKDKKGKIRMSFKKLTEGQLRHKRRIMSLNFPPEFTPEFIEAVNAIYQEATGQKLETKPTLVQKQTKEEDEIDLLIRKQGYRK